MRALFIISFGLLLNFKIWSQNSTIKTITLSVKGNCEECMERIENAVDLQGVKIANWSPKTKVLSITFKTDKITLEEIEEAILNSGHDLDSAQAPLEAYNKLPNCCKYRSGKCEK